jgi:hypothetical protein
LNILSDGENDPYGFPEAEEEAVETHNSPQKKKKKGIWSKIKSSLRKKGKKSKKKKGEQENESTTANTRQTRASRRHAAAL